MIACALLGALALELLEDGLLVGAEKLSAATSMRAAAAPWPCRHRSALSATSSSGPDSSSLSMVVERHARVRLS